MSQLNLVTLAQAKMLFQRRTHFRIVAARVEGGWNMLLKAVDLPLDAIKAVHSEGPRLFKTLDAVYSTAEQIRSSAPGGDIYLFLVEDHRSEPLSCSVGYGASPHGSEAKLPSH